MSDEFLNGYHFVKRDIPDNEAFLEGEGNITRNIAAFVGNKVSSFGLTPGTVTDGHAVYAEGRHSGRITCIVKLECPMVIGSKRHTPGPKESKYAVVEPFMYRDRPAIPATSLKGLISSIAESASRSAYRALENAILTVAFSPSDNPKHDWQRATAGGSRPIGTTHAYFPNQSLPLNLTRSEISPAESLFGYVRDNDDKADGGNAKNRLVAVAGKLRFSIAKPCDNWASKEPHEYFVEKTDYEGDTFNGSPIGKGFVRLKELGEPMKKPKVSPKNAAAGKNMRSATPTMYFVKKENPDSPIAKKEFGTRPPADFSAQGGKFYLHHVDAEGGEPWATRVSEEQDRYPPPDKSGRKPGPAAPRKSAVRPVLAGVTFRFHVDFDNLTNRELGLLCFALQPTKDFRHKIGMGKGIGLGSIKITPDELKIIDRQKRYSSDAVLAPDPGSGETSGLDVFVNHADAHKKWLEKNDRPALNALLKIGETHPFGKTDEQRKAMKPVLWVPLARPAWEARVTTPEIAEGNSFAWFSNNENRNKPLQKLRPIPPDGDIPTLAVNDKPGGGGSGGSRRAGGGQKPAPHSAPAGKTQSGKAAAPSPAAARKPREGWFAASVKFQHANGYAFIRADRGLGDFFVEKRLIDERLGGSLSKNTRVQFTYDTGAKAAAGKSLKVTDIDLL